MVDGKSMANKWRFRSELDRRNYEADKKYVMERRTDNDVRSLTTNAVSGGPHVYTLEYYPRIPERVSTKQTLFKEMLKFHEVRDGGERGDVYGEIEVNKIGKNVVRKKPVGGVSPDICVAECYPHYRFSVVSAQNDCLCFIAEKEIKKRQINQS